MVGTQITTFQFLILTGIKGVPSNGRVYTWTQTEKYPVWKDSQTVYLWDQITWISSITNLSLQNMTPGDHFMTPLNRILFIYVLIYAMSISMSTSSSYLKASRSFWALSRYVKRLPVDLTVLLRECRHHHCQFRTGHRLWLISTLSLWLGFTQFSFDSDLGDRSPDPTPHIRIPITQ